MNITLIYRSIYIIAAAFLQFEFKYVQVNFKIFVTFELSFVSYHLSYFCVVQLHISELGWYHTVCKELKGPFHEINLAFNYMHGEF